MKNPHKKKPIEFIIEQEVQKHQVIFSRFWPKKNMLSLQHSIECFLKSDSKLNC